MTMTALYRIKKTAASGPSLVMRLDGAPMRVIVRLDPNRLRRWHLRLLNRLAGRPRTQVAVEWSKTADELPSAIPLLFALERLIYGLPENDSVSAVAAEDFAALVKRGPAIRNTVELASEKE